MSKDGQAKAMQFCQVKHRHKCLSVYQDHRHQSNIDFLMVGTACLVCFSSSVNGRSKRKRKEAY
jgi:hypothetical protein